MLSASLLFVCTPHAAQWAWTYGATGDDTAHAVQPTADRGYIVVGATNAFAAGPTDAWVLKLDANGNVTWQRTYGGPDYDVASSVQPTADGGYIVVGWTYSFGGGVIDAWVLRLDASGNVIWQKTYGGTWWDYTNSVQLTADGGYVVAGTTSSVGAGGGDALLLKLDANGAVTGCAQMGTSNAAPAESRATAEDSVATVADSSAVPLSSTAAPGNSTAASLQLCSYAALVATYIPTLSVSGLILMSALLGLCGAVMMRRNRINGVDSRRV